MAFSEFVDCVAAVTINCLRANVEDPKVLNSTEKDIRRETKKVSYRPYSFACDSYSVKYHLTSYARCNR